MIFCSSSCRFKDVYGSFGLRILRKVETWQDFFQVLNLDKQQLPSWWIYNSYDFWFWLKSTFYSFLPPQPNTKKWDSIRFYWILCMPTCTMSSSPANSFFFQDDVLPNQYFFPSFPRQFSINHPWTSSILTDSLFFQRRIKFLTLHSSTNTQRDWKSFSVVTANLSVLLHDPV